MTVAPFYFKKNVSQSSTLFNCVYLLKPTHTFFCTSHPANPIHQLTVPTHTISCPPHPHPSNPYINSVLSHPLPSHLEHTQLFDIPSDSSAVRWLHFLQSGIQNLGQVHKVNRVCLQQVNVCCFSILCLQLEENLRCRLVTKRATCELSTDNNNKIALRLCFNLESEITSEVSS